MTILASGWLAISIRATSAVLLPHGVFADLREDTEASCSNEKRSPLRRRPRILLDGVSGSIAGRQFILSRSTASLSTNARTFLNDRAGRPENSSQRKPSHRSRRLSCLYLSNGESK